MENSRSRIENGSAPGGASYHLGSLNHAIDILELLAGAEGPISVTEIAKATSLVKSGAYRILHNLEQRGYVRKDSDSRYALGVGVWRLANSLTTMGSLREQARPLLLEITAATKETTHLAVLERMYSVYVDKAETPSSVRAYAEIGDRAPAHAVATGKVLLAHLEPAELDTLLEPGLLRFTGTTISDPEALKAELARVRRSGFAVNDGEWRHEVVGVAVPARIHGGCTLAIGIAGPRYRLSVEQARQHIPLLQSKARALEAWLS